MNAVLSLISDHFVANHLATAQTVSESGPHLMEHFLSEEECHEQLKEFAAHCDKVDRTLTEAEEVKNFERFYSAVRAALESVGTFEDGGHDEADFSSGRDAEPARVMKVKSGVPVTRLIASEVLSALVSLGSDHAVIFRSAEGRSVLFSNGDFLHED